MVAGPVLQEPRQTILEGWEERLHVDLTTSPPSQGSTMQRGLPWVSTSSSKKRQPQVDVQVPKHCALLPGSSHLGVSFHRDCSGILRAHSLWIWLWWRREGGACNKQLLDLDSSGSYLHCRWYSQPAALLIHRANTVVCSDQGTRQNTGLVDLGPQMKTLPSLELGQLWPRHGR